MKLYENLVKALAFFVLCFSPILFASRPSAFDDLYLDDEQLGSHLQLPLLAVAGEMGHSVNLLFTPWDGPIIPVRFDSSVNIFEKTKFWLAAREWESAGNIDFQEDTKKEYDRYIFVQLSDQGCRSFLGQGGNSPFAIKKRTLNLQRSHCWTHGTILHELGHALGLYHEHQRWDRSQYIKIDYSEVRLSQIANFSRFRWGKSTGEYDFHSIMHYRQFSFNKGPRPTLLMRPGYEKFANVIGTSGHISEGDKATIRELYGEKN